MRIEIRWRPIVALTVLALLGVVEARAKDKGAEKTGPDQQMAFGVKMAQRGLWSEALFRFRQADSVRPDDPRILNNLAVAYEAVGGYEQALETYQKALRVQPNNSDLRRNYSRFVEFYQAFKPEGPASAEEAVPSEEAASLEESVSPDEPVSTEAAAEPKAEESDGDGTQTQEAEG